MQKRLLIYCTFLVFISYAYAQVELRDSVLTWKHFAYTLDDEHRITSWDDSEIVEEEYQGLVVENEYIKLTLVPEFGGRILSFIYKPTGHEQLYQNPVGTPYGMNAGNFYYNWLMVWGGIFPTFSEPEHGKSWLLPWESQVLHESADSVIIQMALKDSINFSGKPGGFNNGETGITCIATVKVFKGKSSFDLDISLINDQPQDKHFEYWTCNTFTPGSEPGNTYSPLNTEMIVPIDMYQARWSPGNWIVSNPIDESAGQGSGILNYENLALLENWKDMGIAYAYPEMAADYYGVINHENEEGIFRVADNSITSGLKFWTWGAGAINNNPDDFYDTKRSYIELWSGLSSEFFADATIAANSTISWKEHFFPTFEVAGLTYANDKGYVYLDVINEDLLEAKINTVLPGQVVAYQIILSQDEAEESYDGMVTADAFANPTLAIELEGFTPGIVECQVILQSEEEEILSYTAELIVPGDAPLGASLSNQLSFAINQVGSMAYQLDFDRAMQSEVTVYDLQGRIQHKTSGATDSVPLKISQPGLYLVSIVTETRDVHVVKFVARW